LIWTDAKEHEYIEESGTMNAMFVMNGTLVSPKTSETILDGVTRDSVLQLANDLDIPVEVRRITVAELQEGLAGGTITEAFGVGTAATIKPIEEIGIDGINYPLVASEPAVSTQLLNELDGIRRGRIADRHHWNIPV
jgi:branched-chain amino acid aminotransferase